MIKQTCQKCILMATREWTTCLVPTERDRLMMSVASCFCILFLTFIFQRTFRQIKDSAWLIIYPRAYPAFRFLFFPGPGGNINIFIFSFFCWDVTGVILGVRRRPVSAKTVGGFGKWVGNGALLVSMLYASMHKCA